MNVVVFHYVTIVIVVIIILQPKIITFAGIMFLWLIGLIY